MQRKVLDSLIARGSFIGIIASKTCAVEKSLQDFARSLCGNAPFLFVEYSAIDENPKDFLQSLRAKQAEGVRYVFVIFRREIDSETAKLLYSMRLTIILSAKGEELDADTLSDLEDAGPYDPNFFWWVAPKPKAKRFKHLKPHIANSVIKPFLSAEDIEASPEAAASTFKALLEIRILRENKLVGLPKYFRKFFFPLCVIAAAIPFVVPSKVVSIPPMMRNVKSELAIYADAPYFDFTFSGTEPLERISRYAVGRFAAVVTNESILNGYMGETLEKNGVSADPWKKDRLHFPPQGTSLRFSIPESISNPAYDSIAPAWKYFTKIIADSVAYVTELYHPKATAHQRLHLAWDVASRSGARILAPFSGKAWTFKDDRGGTVIGIAGKKHVILFMHCDKLLYLDGQNVMQGDPVATVGTTGHTTGPHVHLVTGVVDKKGNKRLGDIRYTVVNPVTWYYSLMNE
ncbi:MAG: peptidoglycan DD-metalloendopeptidase family protein [Fibrobacter sp.]|nr:peptidoglycan DD-metalloendopeptidase family protein [Fibrobacter sp.]